MPGKDLPLCTRLARRYTRRVGESCLSISGGTAQNMRISGRLPRRPRTGVLRLRAERGDHGQCHGGGGGGWLSGLQRPEGHPRFYSETLILSLALAVKTLRHLVTSSAFPIWNPPPLSSQTLPPAAEHNAREPVGTGMRHGGVEEAKETRTSPSPPCFPRGPHQIPVPLHEHRVFAIG